MVNNRRLDDNRPKSSSIYVRSNAARMRSDMHSGKEPSATTFFRQTGRVLRKNESAYVGSITKTTTINMHSTTEEDSNSMPDWERIPINVTSGTH